MRGLRRVGPEDALIGLSLLSMVFAALLPTYRARAFDRLVEDVTRDVEALRAAATVQREANGRWPPTSERGRIPLGVSGAFSGDTTLSRDDYALQWRLWDRVEYVPAPPRPATTIVVDEDEEPVDPTQAASGDLPPDSVGPQRMPVVRNMAGVVVHSANESLLAELLERYGTDVSFARDSSWTLIVEPTRPAS